MAEDKHMTLAEAVAKVQRSVVVPKERYNAHGNFYYRSMEDIVAALKEPCKEAGIAFTLNDSIEQIGERYYVKATCRLFFEDGHGEPLDVTAYAREPLSQKGMNEAQVTGSASSYARKYALCGAFDIDGTSDPDTLMAPRSPQRRSRPSSGSSSRSARAAAHPTSSRAASSTSSSRPIPAAARLPRGRSCRPCRTSTPSA